MEEISNLFEFVKDTPAGALTWHSFPYTGSVEFIVPKGTRGMLRGHMNDSHYYFSLVDGYYTEEWIESIKSKARAESPIPDRFHGRFSPFISIQVLISDAVRFLPPEDSDCSDILEKLKIEYDKVMAAQDDG